MSLHRYRIYGDGFCCVLLGLVLFFHRDLSTASHHLFKKNFLIPHIDALIIILLLIRAKSLCVSNETYGPILRAVSMMIDTVKDYLTYMLIVLLGYSLFAFICLAWDPQYDTYLKTV